MSNHPILKQFGDLTEHDFSSCPVWAAVMSFDYDEPWYDDATEETFRPWTGPLPVSPKDGMYLVQAVLTLADLRVFNGFVTPQDDSETLDLGIVQPQIFLPSGLRRSFWSGMLKKPESERITLYRELGKEPRRIFPIRFDIKQELAKGYTSGDIPGFCRLSGDDVEVYY